MLGLELAIQQYVAAVLPAIVGAVVVTSSAIVAFLFLRAKN